MQKGQEPTYDIHPEELTETERLIIANVLARDEEIRRQERQRLSKLKEELLVLREKSVQDGEEEAAGRVCMRCQTPLGLLFNSGALCPTCEKRVCKDCRVVHGDTWDCSYCSKVREIKAESGIWFYDHNQTRQKRNLYGTALLMRLFKKAPRKAVKDLQDPIWSDFDALESGLGDSEEDRIYVMLDQAEDGQINVQEGNATVADPDPSRHVHFDSEPIEQSGGEKLNLLAMAARASSDREEESVSDTVSDADYSQEQQVPSIHISDADSGEEVEHESETVSWSASQHDHEAADDMDHNAEDAADVTEDSDKSSEGVPLDESDLSSSSSDQASDDGIHDDNTTLDGNRKDQFTERQMRNGEQQGSDDDDVQELDAIREESPLTESDSDREQFGSQEAAQVTSDDSRLHAMGGIPSVMVTSAEEIDHDGNEVDIVSTTRATDEEQGNYSQDVTDGLVCDDTLYDKDMSLLCDPSLKRDTFADTFSSVVEDEELDGFYSTSNAVVAETDNVTLTTDDNNVYCTPLASSKNDDTSVGQPLPSSKISQFSIASHLPVDESCEDEIDIADNESIENASSPLEEPTSDLVPIDESAPSAGIVVQPRKFSNASILLPVYTYQDDDLASPVIEDDSSVVNAFDDCSQNIQSSDDATVEHSNTSMTVFGASHRCNTEEDDNLADDGKELFMPVSHILQSSAYASVSLESNSTAGCEDSRQNSIELVRTTETTATSTDSLYNESPDTECTTVLSEDVQLQDLQIQYSRDVIKDDVIYPIANQPGGIFAFSDETIGESGGVEAKVLQDADISEDLDISSEDQVTEHESEDEISGEMEDKDSETSELRQEDTDEQEQAMDVSVPEVITVEESVTSQYVERSHGNDGAVSAEQEIEGDVEVMEDEEFERDDQEGHISGENNQGERLVEQETTNLNEHVYEAEKRVRHYEEDQEQKASQDSKEYEGFEDVKRDVKGDSEGHDEAVVVLKTPLIDNSKTIAQAEEDLSACTEAVDEKPCVGKSSTVAIELLSTNSIEEEKVPKESADQVTPESMSITVGSGTGSTDEDNGTVEWKSLANTDLGSAILSHFDSMNEDDATSTEPSQLEQFDDHDRELINVEMSSTQMDNELVTVEREVVVQQFDNNINDVALSSENDEERSVPAAVALVVESSQLQQPSISHDTDNDDELEINTSTCTTVLDENMDELQHTTSVVTAQSAVEDKQAIVSYEKEDIVETESVKSDEEVDIDAYFKDFTEEALGDGEEEHDHGEIFMGLLYSEADRKFEVQIHKARDLKIGDASKHATDPYIKFYLLPDASKYGKRKTKTKKHTQNPDYDETLTYSISMDDLLQSTLSCSVWHSDSLGKNAFLGEVEIGMKSYANTTPLDIAAPKWYSLTEKKITRNDLTYAGELVLRVNFEHNPSEGNRDNGTLGVQLVEACNLQSVESDGTSSPYCTLCLFPDKVRRKSTVFPKSVFPIWNENYQFSNISFAELTKKVLQICIYDSNQQKMLGCLRLGCGTHDVEQDDAFGDEVEAWQAMLKDPSTSATYTIPLRSSSGGIRSVTGPLPSSMSSMRVKEKKEADVAKKQRTPSTSSISSIQNKHLGGLQADQYSLTSYGSMTSIYSSSGGRHGNVPISGEISFAIRYDNIAGIFEIHLKKAKDIAPANVKTHTSDPYIKTYLLPDKSKKSKKKSLVKKKSLNPEWNELIKYKIKYDELLKRTLQISVWNNERFGHNDFLGEVQVQIADYVNSGHNFDVANPIWYTLQEMAPVSVSGPDSHGSITIGLKFQPTGDNWGKLAVEIKKAENISPEDEESVPSAFVKCYLLPDKSRKAKRKTSVKKKASPVWNDKIEYDNVSLEELQYRVLEVTVWDHDVRGHNFMGGCRLGLQQGDEQWHDCDGKEVRIWEAMLQHSNIWSEFDIPLRGTMKSKREEQRLQSSQEIAPSVIYNEKEALILSSETSTTLVPGEATIKVGLQYFVEDTGIDSTKKKPKGALEVHLREARYLKSTTSGDFPDAYCKCILHSKKKNAKQQIKAFKKNSQPQWDEKISFPGISPDSLQSKVLEINVVDDVGGRGKELLGSVRLGLGQSTESYDDATGRELELWKEMNNRWNEWVYMVLPLRVPHSILTLEDDHNQAVNGKQAHNDDGDNEGRESPRTLALRAMGSHANEVLDIMEQKTATPGPQLVAHYHNDAEDPHASLGTIEEEPDLERSGSMSTPSPAVSNSDAAINAVVRATLPPASPPAITVSEPQSTSPEVRPGDPPFEAAAKTWEEDEDISPMKRSKMSKISKTKMFGSTDSLASTTSESLAIYGRVMVTGSVQFAMRYDFNAGEFEIHAYSAKDIAIADIKKMTSDPYFKVSLFPDVGRKYGKKKTKVVKGTLNPEWDEIMKIKIKFRELTVKTLVASVWNHDRFGRNEFLGEAQILLHEVVRDNGLVSPIVQWYPLEEKQTLKQYTLYEGSLRISLKFEEESSHKSKSKKKSIKKKSDSSKLFILIQSAKDLPARDHNGLSDPYCKCYLLPEKTNKSKRKTAVIKRTLDPSWDFTIEYDFRLEDFQDGGLELTIWDWDTLSQNDFIGCARLGLGLRRGDWDDAEGLEVEVWQKAMKQPGIWHEVDLPLRCVQDVRPLKIEE